MEGDWREANRANWDERVALHLRAHSYDLSALRAGRGALTPIEEAELSSVDGLRVLHLQCHFGRDSLTLAQRGAHVTGLDFSGEAIKLARALAAELRLSDRARFVCADLYTAPDAIAEAAAFDRVFVAWGALNWLPDIAGWANVVSHFLKPGGALYLAEFHPIGSVFGAEPTSKGGVLNWSRPYFGHETMIDTAPQTYTGDASRLQSGPTYEWLHPLGEIITALLAAGLQLKWLHEHDATPWWPVLTALHRSDDGLWRWPDKPWLPLSFSLWAEKP